MMSLPFVPKRELSRRAQKYQLLVQIYQLLSLLQAGQKRETLIERIESLVGSKGGPVVNAFASRPIIIQILVLTPYMGFKSLLLVLSFAPRGSSLTTTVFPSP